MYFAYILRSKLNGRHYYGHSADLAERLKAHNNGKERSAKGYRPWEVIYYEEYPTKSEAYQREMFFKSIDGFNFLKSKEII